MIEKLTSSNFDAFIGGDKAVIIDFYATWCGPCMKQGELLKAMTEKDPSLKVGKIDVDEEGELAVRFGVSSIPTLLICRNGRISRSFVGLQSEKVLLDAVAEA